MQREPVIIYEDGVLVVLDKPAGMTVNRSDTTNDEMTMQDWVENKLKIKNEILRQSSGQELKIDQGNDFYNRSGIVHRLDKETSGVLIIAKTPEAFISLQKQFKERTVKKTYLALVHGKVESQEGEVRVPVGRLPWNRKRFGVIAGGREAVTRYRTINSSQLTINKKKEPVTLLELYPETGRTHQIRVHLKHIGHPIVSDTLYAGRKTARNDRKILPRVFLHATKISFVHPVKGERMEFESSLPEELEKILQILPINTNTTK